MNFTKHKKTVARVAKLVSNRNTYGKLMYVLDINRWGISEPFSDPENSTMYRDTLEDLANDTFISED